MATLGIGAQGDLVVWAQEHLRSAGYTKLAIDGSFGSKTRWTVSNFQLEEKLPVTGIIDSTTWSALLRWPPAYVRWAKPTNARVGRHRQRRSDPAAEVGDAADGA